MKNASAKNAGTFFFALLMGASFLFPSCKDDKTLTIKEKIVGDWEVTSFTINGVQNMTSAVLNSFDMEYEDYSGEDGDVGWTWTSASGGFMDFNGDYKVDIEDSKIIITFDGYLPLTFEVDIEGNNLTLDGNWPDANGINQKAIIEAEKK